MFWNIVLFTAAYIIFALLVCLKARRVKAFCKQSFNYYLAILLPQAVFIILILVLFIVGKNNSITLISISGVFVYLVGLSIRLKALSDLKVNYNLSKERMSNLLVTKGIYRYSRHPLYLGTLLVHLGLTLTIFSKSGIILYFVFLIPVFLIRIAKEEKEFANDKNYQRYKKSAYCLIPFIF